MTNPQPVTAAFMLSKPLHVFALGFGSGLAPKAPGTVGTLAAVPFALLLWPMPTIVLLLTLLIAFVFGVYCCDVTAKNLGVHDHPAIVWDEFVGYWLAVCFAPPGVLWLLVAFLLFRFFDIVKPWPISVLDKRLGGGMGIMLDDVLAGVMAGLIIWLMAGI